MMNRTTLTVLSVLLLVGASSVLTIWDDRHLPDGEKRNAKGFARDLFDDFSLGRRGLYGIDLVRCKRCRIEKRRQGLLTLGGFNMLILEGLEVILPEPDTRTGNDVQDARKDRPVVASVLKELGIDADRLPGIGNDVRFSGLRINGLECSHLAGTNVVCDFIAAGGKATREGLRLSGCSVVESGRTNLVGSALLTWRPRLRLTWEGGVKELLSRD